MIILEGYYTIKEAAFILGISKRTLYRWLAGGKLDPANFGQKTFIHQEELEKVRNDTK